jgi:hypothetical protein
MVEILNQPLVHGEISGFAGLTPKFNAEPDCGQVFVAIGCPGE